MLFTDEIMGGSDGVRIRAPVPTRRHSNWWVTKCSIILCAVVSNRDVNKMLVVLKNVQML